MSVDLNGGRGGGSRGRHNGVPPVASYRRKGADMSTDLVAEAHAATTKMGTREVVERLNRHLGATLVATLANVNDRKLPYRWARLGGSQPNREARSRLNAAHRIWL